MILFPGVVLPLMVGRERSIGAIQAAVEEGQQVGLLLQRDEQQEEPGPDELHEVGTVAEIVRYWTAQDGRHQAICQGVQRFRVLEYTQREPFLVARIELIEQHEPRSRAIEARFVALKQRAGEVLALSPGAPEDLAQAVQAIDSPSMLADMVATFMDVPAVEKQEVLETIDLKERLDRLNTMLGELSEVLKLSHKIRQDTKGALDQAQREYYLREQLHAIQRELGEGDEKAEELRELAAAIDALDLPPEADNEARKELRRLERMPEQAAEYSMLRTYLEVFTELPWNAETPDRLDLARAERILDEDHYGLEKVKKRILEFLAVRKLNPDGRGPTLCLIGPPGVGKTSLGRSIARAMGRKFVRISLGGIHDEAEIRGHRRTYIGAMPGRILTGLRKAGSKNPVFMLDEMDKLGRGLHGDPSAAMLEVLDPAQNDSFQDSYLGVPFNLRHTLFVATANVLEGIPGPLRDRLEVIHLPGYTEEEKLQIARRYLVQRQLEACGLKAAQCRIDVAALREIIRNYTREAGVRNLEREIGAVCRSVATLFARRRRKPVRITPAKIHEILGPPRFDREAAMRMTTPGVATGLAWTPVGGEILFIEATRMPGKGKLLLTGQLGDVMKESAQAALSLVRNRAEALGVEPAFFDEGDLHMHIPAGAVPKDGPSAGVAMFTALVSLATGRRVKRDVAMTGEVSLRGFVLPVGGIKEKVLGALAAGIKTVLLPARNERDLEEIPAPAREKLDFVLVSDVDEALEAALR
ncbi:MAG: endopeptidase La [bacterium]|nr:endopeptidase La [bacterium]